MGRRAFLRGAMLTLLPIPRTAVAQSERVYRIGYLGTFPMDPRAAIGSNFVRGLREFGYVEGQNLHIERRHSEGRADRLPALVAELISLGLSLIVTAAPDPSRAAKDATATVPIVFVGVADPIGTGLVKSLARPGGNVTGLASVEWEAFTAKQLEVLKEALPRISRVAILMNPTNRMHALTFPQEQAAAARLKVNLQLVEARGADDLESAFEAAVRERADALHVWGDPLTYSHRIRLADLAMKHRLPTLRLFREAVEAGGLLGFGPDWGNIWRGVGAYVDKILKGTKPADMPVAQPTKYELVINMKIAKALGIVIPQSLLLRADQVIE